MAGAALRGAADGAGVRALRLAAQRGQCPGVDGFHASGCRTDHLLAVTRAARLAWRLGRLGQLASDLRSLWFAGAGAADGRAPVAAGVSHGAGGRDRHGCRQLFPAFRGIGRAGGGRSAQRAACALCAGLARLGNAGATGHAGADHHSGEFSGDRLQCEGGQRAQRRALGPGPGFDRPRPGQDRLGIFWRLPNQFVVFTLCAESVCRRPVRLGNRLLRGGGAGRAPDLHARTALRAPAGAGGDRGGGGRRLAQATRVQPALASLARGGDHCGRHVCGHDPGGALTVLGRPGWRADDAVAFSLSALAPPHHRGGPAP